MANSALVARKDDYVLISSDDENDNMSASVPSRVVTRVDLTKSQDDGEPVASGAAVAAAACDTNSSDDEGAAVAVSGDTESDDEDTSAPASGSGCAAAKQRKPPRPHAEMVTYYTAKVDGAELRLVNATAKDNKHGMNVAKKQITKFKKQLRGAKKRNKNAIATERKNGKQRAAQKKPRAPRKAKAKASIEINEADDVGVGASSDQVMGEVVGTASVAEAGSPRPDARESHQRNDKQQQDDDVSESGSDPANGCDDVFQTWQETCTCADIKGMRQCKCKAKPRKLAWWNGKWQKDVQEKLDTLKDKFDVTKLNENARKAIKTLPYENALMLLDKVHGMRATTDASNFIMNEGKRLRNQWGLDDVSSSSSSEEEKDDGASSSSSEEDA